MNLYCFITIAKNCKVVVNLEKIYKISLGTTFHAETCKTMSQAMYSFRTSCHIRVVSNPSAIKLCKHGNKTPQFMY